MRLICENGSDIFVAFMKKSSLIGHAAELYRLSVILKQPVDETVGKFYRDRHYLGAGDRRFISETVFGMVRNARLLEFCVTEASRLLGSLKGTGEDIRPLAYYATFAARIMGENPDAVVEESSPLWRDEFPELDCGSFVNIVKSVEIPDDIRNDPVRRNAILFSFPEFIVSEWSKTYGDEIAEQLCNALNRTAPITIRVNTLRASVDECRRELKKEKVEAEPTPHSPVGLILPKRVNVPSLTAFKRGLFELQDEGSQIVSLLLEPSPGATIVDACAGGGGKSLHLAALMKNQGIIHAIDVEKRRLERIGERAHRAGVSIIHSHLVGRELKMLRPLMDSADGVLIDAPCSGTGSLRRNPGAKLSMTPEFVEAQVRRQQSILESYAPLVKPGGRLVYATCSLLQRENDDMVGWFLERHQEFSLIPADEVLARCGITISSTSEFLRLFPHRSTADGFFAAVMGRAEQTAH